MYIASNPVCKHKLDINNKRVHHLIGIGIRLIGMLHVACKEKKSKQKQ